MPRVILQRPSTLLTLIALLAVAGSLPRPALAALGEQEASVADDAVAARSTIRMQERAGYRMHEIIMPSGTVLHEFVASDGTVFAVAWRGPTLPSLKAALGRYFDQYVDTARLKLHSHRAVLLNEDDLVIRSVGHMRSFTGLAYLPKALPVGVNVGDLQ